LNPIFEIILTLIGANIKYVTDVPARKSKIYPKSIPRE
jgi:hypothetical protein